MRPIRSVGVAGAGTMGAGIAQVALHAGLSVFLYDADDKQLTRAHARISRGLEKKGQETFLSRLHFKKELKELNSADCAIEAAPEILKLKKDIFRELDRHFPKDCLLATNTSALSVGEISKAMKHPERLVGLHFFNPPPVMKLIELVVGENSGEDAIKAGEELAIALGKTVVRTKDKPGFIANRVTRPFYLEAMRMVEAGEGTPIAIDREVREKGGFKMGPFELMDFIGLDVNLAISTAVYEGLGKPANLTPASIQEELVKRKQFGRKNGAGFYLYGNEAQEPNPLLEEILPGLGKKQFAPGTVVPRIVRGVLAEANRAYAEDIASREEIDKVMKIGMAWPKGPFEWEKEL